jgi:subtilisin family serine protease
MKTSKIKKIFFLLLIFPLVLNESSIASEKIRIHVQGNKVSMRLNNSDIRKVLAMLAAKTGFTLRLDESINDTISLNLENVSIERAINALTNNLALEYTYDKGSRKYSITRATSFSSRRASPLTKDKKITSRQQSEKNTRNNEKILLSRPAQLSGKTVKKIERDRHGRPLYRPNEVLIAFTDTATEQQMAALHSRLGSTVLRSLPEINLQRIRLRPGLSVEEAIDLYQHEDIVTTVEKNAIRYPSATTPDDPGFGHLWNMNIIQAPKAWDLATGDSATITAVVDTGVTWTHPDLAANIWTNPVELSGLPNVDDDHNGYIDDIRGWDFGDNDNDPDDMDGHGTHVAGVIAAVGNNGAGVAGINWQGRVMALKVMADNDSGFDTFAIIEALDYARTMGARVVNMSYGSSLYDSNEFQAMERLRQAGIMAVCAAGNDGSNIDVLKEYPASYNLDNIISVAASTSTDNLADFSNYGSTEVDLAAPGENIYSTVPGVTTEALVRHNGSPATEYTALSLEFAGTTDASGITADLVDCGQGYTNQFPVETNGYIALIKRGDRDGIDFYFSQKVTNAQTAGAIGVIIYDNVDDIVPFSGTLQYVFSWIPAVALTRADGENLLARIATTPSVTLVNKLVADPTYHYLSGTSMAAPHVAGAAALLYAVNPDLNYQEARDIILDSVDPIPAAEGITVTGGRLNVFKAIQKAFPGGDVNGDNIVNLADAILILQFLSYQDVEFCADCRELGADINGDGLTGHEEAVYILQKISDMR